ncbi:MAG TPA: hypothetical protein VNL98_00950 [Gemmatimonadales bacterium]|nr:hypothetical protein [Gemmatimonadales bacterium]
MKALVWLSIVAAAAAGPAQVLAQAPGGGAPARQGPGGPGGGGVVSLLAQRPEALNLTPAQQEHARRLAAWLDSLNAPLQRQIQQATGGRAMRDMTPEERQAMMPTLMPLMQQLRANAQRAEDSLRIYLDAAQIAQLDSMRARMRRP